MLKKLMVRAVLKFEETHIQKKEIDIEYGMEHLYHDLLNKLEEERRKIEWDKLIIKDPVELYLEVIRILKLAAYQRSTRDIEILDQYFKNRDMFNSVSKRDRYIVERMMKNI